MSLPPTGEVPHTCKIVNYFQLLIYFWQGVAKLLLEGVAERGEGLGLEGWSKGVG